MTTIEQIIEKKKQALLKDMNERFNRTYESAISQVKAEFNTLKETYNITKDMPSNTEKMLKLMDENLIAIKTLDLDQPPTSYLNVTDRYGHISMQIGPINHKKVRVLVIVEPVEGDEKK